MGIFNIFVKKEKAKKQLSKISVEEQLETLSRLGISPRHNSFVEWICNDWGREEVENTPWYLILYTLGIERELETGWESMSNDIFSFDYDCVDDENTYTRIIEKLSYFSKNDFAVENISSKVDHDTEEAMVSFVYGGNQHHWQLRYEEDCFDCSLLDKINILIKYKSTSKLFYSCLVDKTILVLYTSYETIEALEKLSKWPVYLKFTERLNNEIQD